MRIMRCYTDAAYHGGVAGISFIVRSKVCIYAFRGKVIKVKDNNHAEVSAISWLLDYLLKECSLRAGDKVVIYSDSKSSIKLLNGTVGKYSSSVVKRSVKKLQALRKKYIVDFQYIQAHSGDFNSNTACDRFARGLLRCCKEEVR